MKPRQFLPLPAIVCFVTCFSISSRADAADLYWDADGSTSAATGGTGTWDTTSILWRLLSSTGTLQTYDNTAPSAAIARFGGTAGTVTLSGTLNAGGLNFSVGGYTLTGGTLSLAPSTSPFTYTTNGGTTTINSAITSAGGTQIVKTGSGILHLGTGGGGSGSSPALYTVTGGTFSSGTGTYDSVLSMSFGSSLGVQAASPTTVLTLDSGTLRITGTGNNNALAANRRIQVNAAGGAITDTGTGLFFQAPIINNAGVGSSLHLSSSGTGLTQYQGIISGTGSVTWYGSGVASLQAANTYSGGTVLKAGGIQVTNNSSLGTGTLSFTGNGSLQSGAANLNLANTISLGTTSNVFDTNGNTLTLSGSISNSSATDNAMKVAGTGTLVLSGALNLSGNATDTNSPALMMGNRNGANANRSTLTITGTGSISRISTAWDGTANVLNFASTGTVTMATDLVSGQSAGGVGVVNVTSGTLNLQNLNMANWDGSYGGFSMSGGTINATNVRNGGNGNGNGSSYSILTGGTLNVAEVTTLSRNGTGTNVLHLKGASAQFNEGNNRLNVGFSTGSTGIVTVDSGLLTVASNLSLAEGGAGTSGIVNLNGGTIRPNTVAAPNSAGTSIFNFNGGILQANIDNTGFMGGLSQANIYSGGAKIDTNGKNVTISQVLQGASGSGVSGIAVSTGGSGYLGVPVVRITGGGGTGATAVATMSGGVVTGILITSPGTGYTSAPTVSLIGGGATTSATLGTIATNANGADGGLAKSGTGTLTLTGSNTYSGTTTVSGGVLATNSLQSNGSASGIGQGTALMLNAGTLRYTGTSTGSDSGGFNRTITLGAGGGTLDNSSAGFVFFHGSLSGGGSLTIADSDANPSNRHEWLFTGSSSGFSGAVAVGDGSANSGFLQYRSNNANPFGTGTITLNGGGTLSADLGSSTPSVLNNNLILNGGMLATQTPAMTYSGAITLSASTTSTVGSLTGNTGAITLSNAISGTGALTIDTAPTSSVTISGNSNTYTGATTVNSGKLVVNGNISTSILTTVNSGATIQGVGTTGALTVLANGTYSPGNSIGTLSSSSLTLLGISNFEIDSAGDLSDLSIVSGLLSIGGTLNVTNVGDALVVGDTFNLFDWGSVTGTFTSVNLPALTGTLTWDQSNLYTNGTLVVVPEPSLTAILGGLGVVTLLRRRRVGN